MLYVVHAAVGIQAPAGGMTSVQSATHRRSRENSSVRHWSIQYTGVTVTVRLLSQRYEQAARAGGHDEGGMTAAPPY